jgi:hypothetical protein
MQARHFLSQFFTDSASGLNMPVCIAYGKDWLCPTYPATPDGWAIVQMQCDSHQLEAAAQDPRVLVLPLAFDPSPLPQQVIDVYASWGATTGMSLGALLSTLASVEPIFGHSL